MKLRNKKTGEIFDGDVFSFGDMNSLAELNEEWEDYEEPEGWWFIDRAYEPHATNSTLRNLEADRQIGNYFSSKEEAEKAVEKLKAFKRLTDKGFVFKGINMGDGSIKTGLSKGVSLDDCEGFYEDMDLLFGGKE